MGTNASATTLSGFVERVYPSDIVCDDIYSKCTALAICRKEDFAGDRYVVKVKIAGQQGRSASYSKAVDNRTSSAGREFLFTDVSDYATGGIENKAILTLAGNKNEFKKAIDKEMMSSEAAMTRSFANAFYGEQNGAIGKIKALSNGNKTIELTNKNDAKYFHPGQSLVASSDPAAASPDRATTAVVDFVDRITGKVTCVATVVGDWATSDWIYIDGDFKAKATGFFQLAPKTVASNDSFMGVNRSAARFELAGGWYDEAKGGSTDEVISAAIAWAGDIGADVDTMLVNAIRFNVLCEALKSRSGFAMGQVNSPDRPHIGFKSVSFVNANGKSVDIMPDPFCPRDKSPLFKRDDMVLAYRGKSQGYKLPDYSDFDGLKVRRAREKVDVSEWELFSHYCIANENPANLVNVEF